MKPVVNPRAVDAFLELFLGGAGEHYPIVGPKGRRAVSFASGSNCLPEIRGFVALGIPPGAAADQLVHKKGTFAAAVDEIARLAGTGMPCFLDSGAFGESESGMLITDEEWNHRLNLYLHLAQILGPQLYVVAPDKVRDQAGTCDRLRQFAMQVREVAEAGAQILMPLQPGAMAPDESLAAAQEILGLTLIPAFPMRMVKGQPITEAATVQAFVRSMRPVKIHLLGMGAANKKTQALLDSLWDIQPELFINQDSMLLKSRMGTEEEPRKFDQTMDESLGFCREQYFADAEAFGTSWQYTDEIGLPTQWMGPALRLKVAVLARLEEAETAAFVKDPTEFLNSEWEPGVQHWENYMLTLEVEKAYAECVEERTAGVRRTWGIFEAFKDHPAAWQFPAAGEKWRQAIEAQDQSILADWRESMARPYPYKSLQDWKRAEKEQAEWAKGEIARRKAERKVKRETKQSTRRPVPQAPQRMEAAC